MPQWIKFQLIERPYYDRNGNILSSIEGRRNRKGIDEFSGGGKAYPDITGSILERYEKGNVLLLKLNISEEEALNISSNTETLSFQTTPTKIIFYSYSDFQATIITDVEAQDMKADYFNIVDAVSGVSP